MVTGMFAKSDMQCMWVHVHVCMHVCVRACACFGNTKNITWLESNSNDNDRKKPAALLVT